MIIGKNFFCGKNSIRIDDFDNRKGTFDAEYFILQNGKMRGKIGKNWNDLIKFFKKYNTKTLYFNVPFYIDLGLKNKKYWFRAKIIKRTLKEGKKREYIVIEKQEKNIDTGIREYTIEDARFIKNKICEANNHFYFFDDEMHDFDDEYIQKGIEDNEFDIRNFESCLDECDIDIEELEKNTFTS